jgi:hypothetical protein
LNVVAAYHGEMGHGGMGTEQVRMWRNPDEDRILLMAGHTTGYAVEPRGEYIFGIVAGEPMRSRRGRERRLVLPGQLVAWDPSQAHASEAVGGRPWTSHLMVVEIADLPGLAGDEESDAPPPPRPHPPARAGGPTSPANGRGVCACGGYVREMPGWRVEIVHDGHGDTRTPCAPPPRPGTPPPVARARLLGVFPIPRGDGQH